MNSAFRLGGWKPTTRTPVRRRDPRQTAPPPSDMWWKWEQKTREQQLKILQDRKDWDAKLVPVRAKRT